MLKDSLTETTKVDARHGRRRLQESRLVLEDIDEVLVALPLCSLSSLFVRKAHAAMSARKTYADMHRTFRHGAELRCTSLWRLPLSIRLTARWQFTKHIDVSSMTKRVQIAPLLPYRPPRPVLTLTLA